MTGIRFLVIGIGPGDPELITIKAIRALNRADLLLIPRKGDEKAELAELRREICRRYVESPTVRTVEFDLPRRAADAEGNYLATVNAWHDDIARTYEELVARELPSGGVVGLLVWGDPSLYDSTLRILSRLPSAPGREIGIEVIPGITSVQSLTASHAVPLNELGGEVLFTTGRRLKEGVPAQVGTIVVMLDGDASFRFVPPQEFDILWGAYLGMEGEILLDGPLDQAADEIVSQRMEARARHGWIMDVYILKRKP